DGMNDSTMNFQNQLPVLEGLTHDKIQAVQEVLHSISNNNQVNFGSSMDYAVYAEGRRLIPNNAGGMQSADSARQVTAVNSYPEPYRISVGRTPNGELPFSLQPEPVDKELKKKWRRANTSRNHREKQKFELAEEKKKNEILMKEIAELKNLLQIVTAEKDTVTAERDIYKNIFG
ncbi:unnamed protein product, partial [Meganyctiphanes norvegica]